MRRVLGRAVLTITALLAIAGCTDQTALRDGWMSMKLTDSPANTVTSAVVTIDEIYLQGSDSTDAGARVILRSDPLTVDLLTLANTTDSLFADVVVPGGDYAQLRFVISGAYIKVDQGDGTTKLYASSPDYPGLPAGATVDGQLQMPSFGTSGLKVTVPGSVLHVDGDHTSLLVDFDVSQSFGHGAGADMWVMHPVIRGSELSTTGSVRGTVSLGTGVSLGDSLTLAGLSVQLGGETQALVSVEGAFSYDFEALLPGTYELQVVGPVGVVLTTDPATPMNVAVGGGAATTVDLTITGVH